MVSTKQIENNLIHSFNLVKEDLTSLYNLIIALQQEVEEVKSKLNSGKLVASVSSGKVHTDTCAFAKKIKSKNKCVFSSREEALKAGYNSCACIA